MNAHIQTIKSKNMKQVLSVIHCTKTQILLYTLALLISTNCFAQTEQEIVDSLAKRFDRELVTLSGVNGFSKNYRTIYTREERDALFADSPVGLLLYEKYKKKSRLPKVFVVISLSANVTGLLTYPRKPLLSLSGFGIGSVFTVGAMITMGLNHPILERAISARNREVIFGKYGQYNQ
jgi:hypothetical protein